VLFFAKFISIFRNSGHLGWWHNSQGGPSEDHSTIVWAQLAQQFQRRSFLSDFLPNFLFLVTAAFLKIEINLAKNNLKIISSETTGPIGPKLWWNGL
jgi:hypothetical protein